MAEEKERKKLLQFRWSMHIFSRSAKHVGTVWHAYFKLIATLNDEIRAKTFSVDDEKNWITRDGASAAHISNRKCTKKVARCSGQTKMCRHFCALGSFIIVCEMSSAEKFEYSNRRRATRQNTHPALSLEFHISRYAYQTAHFSKESTSNCVAFHIRSLWLDSVGSQPKLRVSIDFCSELCNLCVEKCAALLHFKSWASARRSGREKGDVTGNHNSFVSYFGYFIEELQ